MSSMHRDTRRKNPRLQRIESRLGAKLAMLTAALNCITAQQPAQYHSTLAREEWERAKQECVAALRAQIDLHLTVFEAEDAQARAELRPA